MAAGAAGVRHCKGGGVTGNAGEVRPLPGEKSDHTLWGRTGRALDRLMQPSQRERERAGGIIRSFDTHDPEIASYQGVVPFQNYRGDQRIREPQAMGKAVVMEEGHRTLRRGS